MSELAKFSDDELEEELERRALIADMPKLLDKPDFTELQRMCHGYLIDLANNDYSDDADHYIFECAMESCFGREVWYFVNRLTG